jgi:hypothetical protein
MESPLLFFTTPLIHLTVVLPLLRAGHNGWSNRIPNPHLIDRQRFA